ncbi:hypothetical protein FACS1894201_09770 [Bacteroidia bacterium]|nr:hypothetical protein FACS1894201_09770 [Bacteroidia bacterium]
MKKILFFAAILTFSAMFTACEKKAMISEAQLPPSSKIFIQTHFPEVAVTSIVKETDGFEKDYTIYLANGFDVEFDRKGNWDNVDGHISAVPQSILDLLPAGIISYVTTNFSQYQIVEINKERYGYEIGLNGEIDLNFNTDGSFRGYDD